MKNLSGILILFLLNFSFAYGQDSQNKLQGRVFSTSNDVTAVHVSNTTENRGTITDFNGYFEISAHLGDTLVFSAVQFKRKEMVVTPEILDSRLFLVALEDALTELNEVVVTPYNLTGELGRDLFKLPVGPIITASTEGIPNAGVKVPTPSQRQLYTARTWDFQFYVIYMSVDLDPLFNFFSGRTKMLNERIAREAESERIEDIRKFYSDSIYINDLKLSATQIDDFIFSCEKDSLFEAAAKSGDRLQLWEVLKQKSIRYLKDNELHKN